MPMIGRELFRFRFFSRTKRSTNLLPYLLVVKCYLRARFRPFHSIDLRSTRVSIIRFHPYIATSSSTKSLCWSNRLENEPSPGQEWRSKNLFSSLERVASFYLGRPGV